MIINKPRWAKWIVLIIVLHLLMPHFGLAALYSPTPDLARHHSTAVHKAYPYMVIVGLILNEDVLPLPLFSYLDILFIYVPALLAQ